MKYLKTIYSLQFPEVKELVEDLWLSKPHYLFDNNYKNQQVGKESEFYKEWIKWSSPIVKFDFKEFNHFYATAGSSEAIREVIWTLKQNNKRLVLFENDYEGYSAFAESSCLNVIKINRDDYLNFNFESNDVVMCSNPSSIDGSFWLEYDSFMKYMLSNNNHVDIYLDLCYVGTTNLIASELNLTYSNIKAIFISLSKTYGIYFHRVGGVISKNEIKGLYGNQWFKNMFALELGIKLMQKFPVDYFSKKYEKVKNEVVRTCEKDLNIKIKKNDILILAISEDIHCDYQRGNLSRICLTPLLLDQIILFEKDCKNDTIK